MAIKGLSVPVLGVYSNNNGTVTYANGRIFSHAVEYSFDAESSDENPLYGDNRIVEHDSPAFTKGTLTVQTTNLSNEDSKYLLGLKEVTRTIGQREFTELVYDDDRTPKTFGFGIIELFQLNDTDGYRPVVFCRCTPNIPSDAATTKGEQVEWQTPEIEFTVVRSEQYDQSYHYPWKFSTEVATEADAILYLKNVLGVPEG